MNKTVLATAVALALGATTPAWADGGWWGGGNSNSNHSGGSVDESVNVNEAVTDVPRSAEFAEFGWKPA